VVIIRQPAFTEPLLARGQSTNAIVESRQLLRRSVTMSGTTEPRGDDLRRLVLLSTAVVSGVFSMFVSTAVPSTAARRIASKLEDIVGMEHFLRFS
jgi:hypothetical protein